MTKISLTGIQIGKGLYERINSLLDTYGYENINELIDYVLHEWVEEREYVCKG